MQGGETRQMEFVDGSVFEGSLKSRIVEKLRLLEPYLPNVSGAQAETLEILMDVEQVNELLTSFQDLGQGRVVAFEMAFSDL